VNLTVDFILCVIGKGYGLAGPELESLSGLAIFLFFKRSDRLWGPPSLYSLGIGILSQGQSGRGILLITHLCLAPKLGISGAKPHLLLYAFKE